MSPIGDKPKSDGIRKKVVNTSFPSEKKDPHEEGIIITELVSEPLSEPVFGPKVEPVSSPQEEGKGQGGPQNTFFFESEPTRPIKKNRPWATGASKEPSSRAIGRVSPLWWGLSGGLGAVLVLGVLLSTVFARITITLKPRVDTITLQDTLILMDTSVSRFLSEQKVIPAERLEFNKKVTDEFESTGREYIEEKARGKVRIYNRFSSSPQTLVEGTRFLTDSGALYRLSKSTVIPGAKVEEGKIIPESVEVELAADKAGEEGNLGGDFTLKIPGFKGTAKYEGFYASSSGGFSGGFKGEARVVSKEDLKKAEEQVTKRLYEELQQEMARKIPFDFKVMDALREIQVNKLEAPRLNIKTDKFSVGASGRGRLIIFRESDSVAVLKEAVLKDDKTREYMDGSANLQYQIRSVDFEKGRAEAVVRGSLKAKAVVSEKELAEAIKNKKEGSMAEILKNRNELAAFSLAFFPPWLSKAPSNPLKIKFIEK